MTARELRTARRGSPWRLVLLAAATALLTLLLPALAAAQEPTIEAEAALEPPQTTLGSHVRLVVTVLHPEDLLITAADPVAVEGIELVRREPETIVVDEFTEDATTTFVFVLAGYDLGSLQPGTIDLSWLREDGLTGETQVQPPALEVLPVRAPGDEELRPLKPQALVGGAPAAWVRPAIYAGVTIGGLAVALFAWSMLRKQRQEAEEEPVAPDLNPEDVARARLDALAAGGPARWTEYPEYYGAISLILRQYLEARFEFRATALTTAELERRMASAGVTRWQARLVSGLLARCDAAVYAGIFPDPASADHDLTVAYEIVELSRPKPQFAEAVPA